MAPPEENENPHEELRDLAAGLRRHLLRLQSEGTIGGFELPVIEAPPVFQNPVAVPFSASLTSDLSDARRPDVTIHGSNPRDEAARKLELAAIDASVRECRLCRLCEGRTRAVPGEGNPMARLIFVGEGPGATEDRQGRPFVGAAGQLLTRIIEGGMGIKRSDVFITNVVKCRPPENRDPAPDEVAACLPYLFKQIEILDPEVLVPLGRYSMRELAGATERDSISRMRGKVYRVQGRAVIPTFHPAYLLRSPDEKPKVWHDIQLAMKELGLPLPPQRNPGA